MCSLLKILTANSSGKSKGTKSKSVRGKEMKQTTAKRVHFRDRPSLDKTCHVSDRTMDSASLNGTTTEERLVEEYLEAMNAHASVDELLSFYANDSVTIVQLDNKAGAKTSTARDHHMELAKLFPSFKNLHVTYESMTELPSCEDQQDHVRVLVEDVCVTGTHNGQPYKFRVSPVIPRTNKHVVLDCENMVVTFHQGKIARQEIVALGSLTGSSGMYRAIGGKLHQ
jgi:hypothetical protein